MQKHSRKYLVLAFLAALTSGAFCLAKDDTVNAESLLAQARKLQEAWTDGTPPLRMRTEIQMLDAKGEVTRGQYIVTWLSTSRWREELEFADYKRLRIHDAKGYWQQSTLDFQPKIIFQLDSLLDCKTVLKLEAKQGLGKVKSNDNGGVRQKCTGVKGETGTERILCFDEASGNLLSVEFPGSEPPDISRIEYSAFNKLGDKQIPFEVRAFKRRAVIATAKVLEVTPMTEDNPALFVAPSNSEFWAECNDMRRPELISRIPPIYPTRALSAEEQGRVWFYAVIESDGTLSHLTVIQQATPALESAALEAVRQWHYKPASCGSTPIRLETSLSVGFRIR